MKIKLSDISTRAPKDLNKDTIRHETMLLIDEMNLLQDILIASKQRSMLVILQGMDASGKDGAVKKVFGQLNPLGIRLQTFKKPTEEEMAHDFLWRIHKVTPQKGEIVVFNRSHYEDVLIQRIHGWISEEVVQQRFEAINNFEKLLEQNGTKIIKCYLHISPEEQLKRLQERVTVPQKMWKHHQSDWDEREHWDAYMSAYESVFEHCSKHAKWHIIPVDQNWKKENLIAKLVRDELRKMKLHYPLIK